MAKKNDSPELQNDAELQKNVENMAAPAETGPLVHGDANSTGTVPATSDANAVSPEGAAQQPPQKQQRRRQA